MRITNLYSSHFLFSEIFSKDNCVDNFPGFIDGWNHRVLTQSTEQLFKGGDTSKPKADEVVDKIVSGYSHRNADKFINDTFDGLIPEERIAHFDMKYIIPDPDTYGDFLVHKDWALSLALTPTSDLKFDRIWLINTDAFVKLEVKTSTNVNGLEKAAAHARKFSDPNLFVFYHKQNQTFTCKGLFHVI
jgi:hypothetical protein